MKLSSAALVPGAMGRKGFETRAATTTCICSGDNLRLLASSSTRSWMELPPLAEFQMMVKMVNPRLLTSSSTRSWMELSPLIKFEMVAKASLCMFIDRPSWTMQSIDPLRAFFFGQLCFDETEEMLHKTVSA